VLTKRLKDRGYQGNEHWLDLYKGGIFIGGFLKQMQDTYVMFWI
jgi:hypothetical protein